jgi:hypothetical protein
MRRKMSSVVWRSSAYGAVVAVSVAGAFLSAAAAQRSGAAQETAGVHGPAKSAGVPRTSFGQPDMQGVWSFAVLTPLARPAELAGK